MRSCAILPKTFFGSGQGHKPLACPARPGTHMPGHGHTCQRADVALRSFVRSVSRVFPALLRLLPSCLLVVVALAQALVIGRVGKQLPVSAMGLDVIHHRGSGAAAWVSRRILPGALPAKRLSHELSRAQVIRPDGKAVPAMPLGRDPAARFYGLVLGAVSIAGQRRASWVPTRPQRLLCHRAITSGQNKKRLGHRHSLFGSCLMAQALVAEDSGSGASIFTMLSCPHRLHGRGRL